MFSIETLITFTFAALLMNLSPGPSFLYLMARTLAQGTRGGLAAVVGLATGSFIHAMAVVLGLSTVFLYSPTIYTVLKIAGALYLLYLGVQHFRSPATQDLAAKPLPPKRYRTIFHESVLVELTNPKTILFYLAVLPQFVNYEAGNVGLQLGILGLIVTLSAMPCDILVCLSTGRAAAWLNQSKRARRALDRAAGSILITLGCYVLVSESR